jgi:hypothetical protein
MAQNRFLTAVETLWESVLTANGAAKTRVLKQRFNDIIDFPVGVSIHAEMHPIQLYTHGPLREIRDRLRDAFRESIEDEDVRSIIDALTVIDSSPQFLLMTSVISKFRQWRSSLEHSDSDSSSDSEED